MACYNRIVQNLKGIDMRKISFQDACKTHAHRFTMEHVPTWAKRPANNGKYYAPQYASDHEWYNSTVFPGEGNIHSRSNYCESTNETWPIGQWLDKPYIRE